MTREELITMLENDIGLIVREANRQAHDKGNPMNNYTEIGKMKEIQAIMNRLDAKLDYEISRFGIMKHFDKVTLNSKVIYQREA